MSVLPFALSELQLGEKLPTRRYGSSSMGRSTTQGERRVGHLRYSYNVNPTLGGIDPSQGVCVGHQREWSKKGSGQIKWLVFTTQ